MTLTSDIIFVSSDLMFYSQINSAARGAGLSSAMVKLAPQISERTNAGEVKLVIVDLFKLSETPKDIATYVREHCGSAKLIAFGPHVEKDALEAASDAGFDEVMTRSKFHQILPSLFKQVN